jgi:hypothetical protein
LQLGDPVPIEGRGDVFEAPCPGGPTLKLMCELLTADRFKALAARPPPTRCGSAGLIFVIGTPAQPRRLGVGIGLVALAMLTHGV